MTGRILAVRFLCLAGMAAWAGGFAFYGAAVVPVLHENLERLQAGEITRRVTDTLNIVGAATVAVWWIAAVVESGTGAARARRTRLALLGAISALLLAQVGLHRIMDGRLDEGHLRAFYPLHRADLILSTVQWFLNMGLLAVSALLWGGGRDNHS